MLNMHTTYHWLEIDSRPLAAGGFLPEPGIQVGKAVIESQVLVAPFGRP